jgi:hypothetical protein
MTVPQSIVEVFTLTEASNPELYKKVDVLVGPARAI